MTLKPLFGYVKPCLNWVPIQIVIQAHKNSYLSFPPIRLKPVQILAQRATFFSVQSHELKPQLYWSGKIQMRVLGKVAIYTCIDNSYLLNKHPIVDNVLEFNPTNELDEKHGFTQFNWD
jgi:hypothetical protein